MVRNGNDEAGIEAITQGLEQNNWDRDKTASLVQISYRALRYNIRHYDIQRSSSLI